MRKIVTSAVLSASLLLGACSTIVPRSRAPGQELVGQTLRVETSRGQASSLRFEPNGAVVAMFGANEVRGRWQLQNRQLCFMWTGAPRECWPYSAPFRRGLPVGITSDRGNQVRVTLL